MVNRLKDVIYMTIPTYEALTIIAKRQKPTSMAEVKALMSPENQKFTTTSVIGLLKRKAIKSNGKLAEAGRYSLTALGGKIIDMPNDKLILRPPNVDQALKAAKSKARNTATPAVAHAPVSTLNLSKNADSAMDFISAVIKENHDYRELLKRVATQIAAAIGLTIIDSQDGVSEHGQS